MTVRSVVHTRKRNNVLDANREKVGELYLNADKDDTRSQIRVCGRSIVRDRLIDQFSNRQVVLPKTKLNLIVVVAGVRPTKLLKPLVDRAQSDDRVSDALIMICCLKNPVAPEVIVTVEAA